MRTALCFFCLLLLTVLCGGIAYAENTVVGLDPLRLVFKDGKNSSRLNITNTSEEQRQYKIISYPLRMDRSGVLSRPRKVTKREALAKKMVHFSPRVTVVPPGRAQIVRVAVRRPPGLPDGDYFTYINVSPVPLSRSVQSGKQGEGAFSLNMNIGVSIPIIVSVGENNTQVSLKSVHLVKNKENKDVLHMTLKRDGKFNSYNSIAVYGMVDGNEKMIAYNKRVVTYVPVKERDCNVNFFEQGFTGHSIRVVINNIEGKKERIIKSYNINI